MCKDTDNLSNIGTFSDSTIYKKSYRYIHIKPCKRPFDSTALDLIGPFHPSLKGNTYVLNIHVSPHEYIVIPNT